MKIFFILIFFVLVGFVVVRNVDFSQLTPKQEPQRTIHDELKVEGVSHEPGNPEASVVVINGYLLKVGEEFENYKVVAIESNAVRVQDLNSGKEHRLQITGSGRFIPTPAHKKLEALTGTEPAPGAPQPSVGAPQSFPQAMESLEQAIPEAAAPGRGGGLNPLAGGFNPLAYIGKAQAMSVIADLRGVHVAAMIYYSEMGSADGLTIQKLVDDNMLSTAFSDGVKTGYKFSIKEEEHGIEVHANPLQSGLGQQHYMIDEHGEMFVEDARPATHSSKEYTAFSAETVGIDLNQFDVEEVA